MGKMPEAQNFLIPPRMPVFFVKKNLRSFCSAKASLIFFNKNTRVFSYKVMNHLTVDFLTSLLRPPSHSDKDHKDRTTFLKRDKRRENGTKCRKNTVFKFVLRPYYAPARMLLRLTRSSYVLSRA